MRTDDDLFENLDIGGDTASSRSAREAVSSGGGASEDRDSSVFEDLSVFEELDMGDRILASAAETSAQRPAAASPSGGGAKPGKQKKKLKEYNTAESGVDIAHFDREKKRKKKAKIRKFIIAGIVELLTLLVIFAYGYFLRSWNLIQRLEINAEAVENNNLSVEKKEEMERGYWTVALFGVDSRTNSLVERGLNSDVIIIVSIDRATGAAKLVSIFRDTYLNISESNTYSKINAAYSMGGPEQALAALNKNLDLNITEYAAFNWKAVADGINILGGVDGISISKAELYYINAFITETVNATGVGSYQLTSTGEQHLDGVQAVAYARLRLMDNDYARTERQRKVIKACFEKAKKADFAVLNNILVVCFPQIATNINFNTVISMAQNITSYSIADTAGFPWQRGEAVIKNKGDCVVPATLESNVVLLHEFLYGVEDYEPTSAVKAISETIKENSGIYREGQVINSVSTDGGVISSPKTVSETTGSDEESTALTEATIGVDEDGRYIYPTDENGDIIYPTDENGDIVYPTDENGDIIRETVTRPTSLAEGEAPGEGGDDEQAGPAPSTAASPVSTSPYPGSLNENSGQSETDAAPGVGGEEEIVTPVPTETTVPTETEVYGPGSGSTVETAAGPGVSSGPGTTETTEASGTSGIVSVEGPGSVTVETAAGPVVSDTPQ